ncbi:dipeptide ABC transporter ATP-binding protein [Subtercola frigoramans]|uniref:Peptide/nickel transport system ATP-binding protein n=1 Tax=Subtercola frigoramans TaxID=120298 RepID=A0ABS2L9A7_9MICO|nr:ABC transporter ATP-binding protein [Subtercola frigoramans]MBM7473466.1 peptide/nickel transport system ATP-binding protein [Subtercola frigoramans]
MNTAQATEQNLAHTQGQAPAARRSEGATLDIQGLTVSYSKGGRLTRVLDDVSFCIRPGEAYGLVGESGSGKSTLAFGTVRYLAPNAVVESGRILFRGVDVLTKSDSELRVLRGSEIAMVYQDPSSSLNPSMKVGDQIAEVYRAHDGCTRAEATSRAHAVLEKVAFPDPAAIYPRYPHQLSGGQQQRVVIAMALAGEPSLLVLDEPTTGLDLSVQAEVLTLVRHLHRTNGIAMLFISHDLATVRKLCDRIGVMRHGRLLEEGEAEQVFTAPRHPYTRGLIDCLPREGMHKNGVRLRPIEDDDTPLLPEAAAVRAPVEIDRSGPPVLEVTGLTKSFGGVRAARDISLTIHRGEVVGLVGESGSGKSTLGRLIVGLESADSGRILLGGRALAGTVERRSRAEKRSVQMVFQRPDTTLNPRRTVRATLRRAISKLDGSSTVAELAARVRLGEVQLATVPRRLSGGMKQRVAIARAFAGDPDVVVCDEPTSALDPSIQASILNELADIAASRGTAYLFISHDLEAVRYIADRVVVLYLGEIVEQGPVDEVMSNPQHPYTKKLLAASASRFSTEQ